MLNITIKNWIKYNPRKDIYHSSWFRLQNDLFDDPDLFNLDATEIAVFVYILSLASKKNNETITVNIQQAEQAARIPKAKLESAITKLEAALVVTRNVDVTSTLRARTKKCSTYVRTDVRTYMLKDNFAHSNECAAELDSIYDSYPRKRGKQRGYKLAMKYLQGPKDVALLKQAVENFKKEMAKEKRASDKILYFSSFMMQWKEWISPEKSENFNKNGNGTLAVGEF